MKKIVVGALILALIGGSYFWFKSKQNSQNGPETSKSSPTGVSTDDPTPEASPETSPGATPDASPANGELPSETPTSTGTGSPGSTSEPSAGKVDIQPGRPSKSAEDGGVDWIQGSIGLRGDHVRVVDSFVSAVEERNPDSLTRFFSSEMKARKSIAGRGKLKAFIKQSLMGEGFFGGLTNPDARKTKSVRGGAFHLTVKFEVSNPQNDEEDIPVTVKFQFEDINGSYVITQVSETRG